MLPAVLASLSFLDKAMYVIASLYGIERMISIRFLPSPPFGESHS
jgi:hypothetical protein